MVLLRDKQQVWDFRSGRALAITRCHREYLRQLFTRLDRHRVLLIRGEESDDKCKCGKKALGESGGENDSKLPPAWTLRDLGDRLKIAAMRPSCKFLCGSNPILGCARANPSP
jgi:hypothetical protein